MSILKSLSLFAVLLAGLTATPARGDELDDAQDKAIQMLKDLTKKAVGDRLMRVKYGLAGISLTQCKEGSALTVEDNIKPKEWKVARVGVALVGDWRVMHVVSPDSAVVSLRSSGTQVSMLIHRFDTSKHPVGSTTTYSGLNGSIKTPPVLYVYGKESYDGDELLAALIVHPPEGVRFIVGGLPVE